MDYKLKRDLFMFLSFVLLSSCIYVYHILQSADQLRGYITGFSLIIAWFIMKKEPDLRLQHLWGSFMVWVIHSNVYFDVRSHYVGFFRFIKHIIFLILVLYLRLTPKRNNTRKLQGFRNIAIILFWLFISLFPDQSSNAYGNVLFSILRLFCVTVLVMTRYKDEYYRNELIQQDNRLHLDEFCWIFFVYELFLLVCIVQLVQDIFPLEAIKKFPFIKFQDTTAVSKSNTFKNPEVEKNKSTGIITLKDVPFLKTGFNNKGYLNQS